MKEAGHPETAPLYFLIKSQGSAPSRPSASSPVLGDGVGAHGLSHGTPHHIEQALSCA